MRATERDPEPVEGEREGARNPPTMGRGDIRVLMPECAIPTD